MSSLALLQDGNWFTEIATSGYRFDPTDRSPIAFFPAYPLLGWAISKTTHLPTPISLLIASNISLLFAFVLFSWYLSRRCAGNHHISANALVAFALFPPTFFYRMAYSEALFILVIVGVLMVIQSKSHWLNVSVLAGLATATRVVGLAVLPVAIIYAWRDARMRAKSRLMACVISGVVSCWGIGLYMAYLGATFGSPLAFAENQTHWRMVSVPTITEKWIALVTLRPIFDVYREASPNYWEVFSRAQNPLVSLQFANPIWFLLIALAVGIGSFKRWLTVYEIVLSVGLLGIAYYGRAYEWAMNSQARVAAVVVPAYLVYGVLLSKVDGVVRAMVFTASGVFMFLYAALFSAGHPFF